MPDELSNGRPEWLPTGGAEREALRVKGQFWTPDWVARAMVAYALATGSRDLFDPAVGEGVFLQAAKLEGEQLGRPIRLAGRELDEAVLSRAAAKGLSKADLIRVELRDFVLDPPRERYGAIVANPPYIRHHRLDAKTKQELKQLAIRIAGIAIDGRAGLHVYFLIAALDRLALGGRLAFIMPADTAEGVFAPALWAWITRHYRVNAVVAFEADASPFPGVDTNPLVFFLERADPRPDLSWVLVDTPNTSSLASWARTGRPHPGLRIHERTLAEALTTGLSRPPRDAVTDAVPLSTFAEVRRGIATGANDFFVLAPSAARRLCLRDNQAVRVVAKTRDTPRDEVADEDVSRWDREDRPTVLLSLGSETMESLQPELREYLQAGVDSGLHERSLVRTRRPWYRMEKRAVPPILFAYLGRRATRFVRNRAGVVPLTGFLCVYVRPQYQDHIEVLWTALNDERTLANLRYAGKSYGSGAIKVEPRSLERLQIPLDVLKELEIPVDPTIWGPATPKGMSA